MKSKLTQRLTAVMCAFAIVCSSFLGGCVTDNQNVELADIDATFEEDYPLLQQVNDYIISVSNELNVHMVLIKNNHGSMVAGYGNKMPIENEGIVEAIQTLFKKGYMYISLNDGVTRYERWKKSWEYEYRAGFAYSPNSTGELDIQYIIHQRELSVDDWYYYEEDYNEWRVRKSTDTAYGH